MMNENDWLKPDNILKRWPEPPCTSMDRLLHTLDIYLHSADEMRIIDATSNVYPKRNGEIVRTGLTLGDLRALVKLLGVER